jgi:site-specific recombinase XerD
MSTEKTLSQLVQDYFYQRLINQRDLSQRTIATYRDSIRLFLCFAQKNLSKRIDKLQLEDLNVEVVLKFLEYLENDRKNSVRTRNNRLAAIRSFMQYVASKEPTVLPTIERVLAIPLKRFDRPLIGFLTREEMIAIINAPDIKSWSGNRDHVLFATMYNTGARVSEIINIKYEDIDLVHSKSILLHGKGRKERTIPLWKSTIKHLENWIKESDSNSSDSFVFLNRDGKKLTRSGVEYRLSLAVAIAAIKVPSLKNKNVSPHVIRHTTAMHLLQSGVDLAVLALWLGHEEVTTTHHYIEADITMKEKALSKIEDPKIKIQHFKPKKELLAFLDAL